MDISPGASQKRHYICSGRHPNEDYVLLQVIDFNQADSGTIPALLMLELVSKRDKPLSELLKRYRERYFLTGELNMPVEDVALKLQELKEHFAGQGEISHLDGISVTAENWHMNVRPSNTEPLLRLNLEALDPELMERKRDEVLEVIRS